MKRKHSPASPPRLAWGAWILAALFAALPQAAAAQAQEVMIEGLAWRQLTDTAAVGLSWDDVASVCPLDESPCQGAVKGVDLTGWTWASPERVEAMLEAITGIEVPFENFQVSSVERVFDLFDPAVESTALAASIGLSAASPASGRVEVTEIQDARTIGRDRIGPLEIATDATSVTTAFGGVPVGVFLVRDPDLELCSNGIDDDGDGAVDVDDADCTAVHPVVNGLEWRQLTATTGIDFWDVVDICPAGGFPCAGSIGAVDFTGWTWASAPEVVELLYTLTGTRLTTSPSTVEFFTGPGLPPSPIPTVFATFEPTIGTSASGALYGFTYDSSGEDGSGEVYPEPDPIWDPDTCNNGLDDDGDGRVDFADANCLTTDWFFVSNQSGDRMGTLSGGTTSNPYYGFFLHRTPQIVTPEVCDNTFDDDGNGLIDLEDPACEVVVPRVGLLVECLHEPIWVPEGEPITVRARAIDGDGNDVVADRVEIYVNNSDVPAGSEMDATTAEVTRDVSGRSVQYGCRAERGRERAFSGFRDVDIGAPVFDKYRATPVIYNGPLSEKLDVVFMPDLSRHPQGMADPQFLSDVHQVIDEGLYGIPWFVRNQSQINYWIAHDQAVVVPNPAPALDTCEKGKPVGFRAAYAFADAVGILHDQDCRDNASFKLFTTQFDPQRLQVVAHEIGHAAFTLSDEYEGAFSLYFTLPDFPNLLPTEGKCRSAAEDRGFDPDECRILDGASGFFLGGLWIFEPDYSATNPETPDLMQQTGTGSCDEGTCIQYRVGPSETDRMRWKLRKCRSGRC